MRRTVVLTANFRALLQGVWNDLLELDDRVCEMDKTIKRLADNNEDCVRLQQLRGIGPMTATAMIASVGDARQYHKGRQMAAAPGPGITPETTTLAGDRADIGCLHEVIVEQFIAVMFICVR